MSQPQSDFWFPVKRYGWGWGIPVRWQGWAVLALYFSGVGFAIREFLPRQDMQGFFIALMALSATLFAVCAWKGERPVRWRWGGK